MRRGRQQLTDESLGQPGLETLRGPAPAMDQHVIRPGTEQPDDVCGSGGVESFPQTSFPHEIDDDVGGPLTVLGQMGLRSHLERGSR